jgi:hypothetical protein
MKAKGANLWGVCLLLVFWNAASWAGQAGEVVEVIGSGEINWSQGIVTARGSGAPPKESKNIAQARLMTERAALADARRNLLETLKGVRIDSVTHVEDFIAKSDEIRLRTEGVIQASTEVRKLRRYLSDGAIEVTVAMNWGGDLLTLLLSLSPSSPAAKPPAPFPFAAEKPGGAPLAPRPEKAGEIPPAAPPLVKADEKPVFRSAAPKSDPKPSLADLPPYTGLVVDTRGLKVQPALVPKVLDEKGMEIYLGPYVSRENAAQSGVALYAKDLTSAQTNSRVGKNPLTVKGFKVNPGHPSDIILPPEETRRVAPFTQKGTFLEECKVMIVID